MANKEELKKKLDEVKAQIKANSKDTHFADTLISELLSLKGQIDVEPLEFYVKSKDVIKTFDGESFELSYSSDGAWYREKGMYKNFVFIHANNSAYDLIRTVVDSLLKEDLEEEPYADIIPNLFVEIVHLMKVPSTFIGIDGFRSILANKFHNLLNILVKAQIQREKLTDDDFESEEYIKLEREILTNYAEKVIEDGVQEETIEQDTEFKNATLALEEIKEQIKKEQEEGE